MNRVVITGMGAFTSVGRSVETLFESLKAGHHGMGLITRFDTTDFKAKVAAEIRDYNPLEYLPKAEARKMDLFTQYAMIAAAEAMGTAAWRARWTPSALACTWARALGAWTPFCPEPSPSPNRDPGKYPPSSSP